LKRQIGRRARNPPTPLHICMQSPKGMGPRVSESKQTHMCYGMITS
jgi:hypothetical protein